MQIPREGQVDVWVAGPQYPDQGMAGLLSTDELARLDRFLVEPAREDYLRGHVLLRVTLAAYTGQSPERLAFATGSSGRPELAGGDQPRFSLSHTRGLAAVAVAADAVGVDVEATARNAADLASVAEHYFAPAEREQARNGAFFDLWTLKEACLKAMGRGLAVPLDHVVFDLGGERPRVHFDPSLGEDAGGWSFALMTPLEDYRLAVAVRHPRLVVGQTVFT